MRLLYIFFFFFFLFLSSCTHIQKQENISNELWHLDVTREYPTKEIYIQDIADVDYIPLETNDSMLWLGRELRYLDEDCIMGASHQTGVYFHDGKGNAQNSFNKIGQGPEDYTSLYTAKYRKTYNEVYILDILKHRYCVYDNKGNFKRIIKTGGVNGLHGIGDFCILSDRLLQYYNYQDYYTLLSLDNGEKIKDIKYGAGKVSLSIQENGLILNTMLYPFIKDEEGCYLSFLASDTIFLLTPDMETKAVGIRTPSVKEMEIPIFVFPRKNTKDYFIVEKVKKEKGFPSETHILDKKENKFYRLDGGFKNRDYAKMPIYLDAVSADMPPNMAITVLSPTGLCMALERGLLSGKLKDIAANLKEDDNPVLMVIKFKE